MTDAELLMMTKSNLQIAGSTWDEYLTMLIEASRGELATQGITLDLSRIDDCNLVVMYASYLYRKRAERADDNPSMPQMLRFARNNRLLSQKAAEEG